MVMKMSRVIRHLNMVYLIQATRSLSLTKNASSGKRGEFFRILSSQINTGRIARRNRVHLKNDQTPAHSEPGPQKPLQRNSELGPQKPPQGNFELGPQKPPQGNFEPVTQNLFVNSYRLNQKPILLIVVLLKSKRSPALM